MVSQGETVGPALCDALKAALGKNNVACQGVGSPYAAAINDNFLPKGTSDAAIGEATRLFNVANTKCPATKVIASGYRSVYRVKDPS
jgi:cutinase